MYQGFSGTGAEMFRSNTFKGYKSSLDESLKTLIIARKEQRWRERERESEEVYVCIGERDLINTDQSTDISNESGFRVDQMD